MDATPRPDGKYLIEEAPVVPSWSNADDDSVVFLRPDPPVTLFLSIDTSKNTSIFRIRVPFQVDSIHNCLYALIDPGQCQRRSCVAHRLHSSGACTAIVGAQGVFARFAQGRLSARQASHRRGSFRQGPRLVVLEERMHERLARTVMRTPSLIGGV